MLLEVEVEIKPNFRYYSGSAVFSVREMYLHSAIASLESNCLHMREGFTGANEPE